MSEFSIGYLTVNVRYANGTLPISNCRIVLERAGTFFGEFRTDEDGKTSMIPLSDGNEYGLKVYAEGFYEKECGEISVFPKITTLQNVNLFPRGEDESDALQ